MDTVTIGDRVIDKPFTIPSGIVTVTPDTIRLFDEIPELGVITTKSIGVEPRGGNELPIFAEIGDGTYQNAVGLPNPGYREFRREMEDVYPLKNSFLLTSIFGGNKDEFREIATGLRDVTDGFELNFSCPHDEGHGVAVGKDVENAAGIVRGVKGIAGKKPVFVKVSPMFENLGGYAKAMEDAGADGITAINTAGPEESDVISIGIGGISGRGIKDLGIHCVREIRGATDLPIIAMGGIETAEDVRRYREAGADIFGVGSALTGMCTNRIREYFHQLWEDMEQGGSRAGELLVRNARMQYAPYKIDRIVQPTHDLRVYYFDGELPAQPGQFVMAWVPGVGERPFSLADNTPLTLAVRKIEGGPVTTALFEKDVGDDIQVRGPYGNPFPQVDGEVYLIGGGTGVAPLHFYVIKNPVNTVFIGGKTWDEVLFAEEFDEHSILRVATEDGSSGYHGTVTDLLKTYIESGGLDGATVMTCGPRGMMTEVVRQAREVTSIDDVYGSLEQYMKCGVGVCGSCATPDGYRSCVDGPLVSGAELAAALGQVRGRTGEIV